MNLRRCAGPTYVRAQGATTLPAPQQSSISFALGAEIARADIPRLCCELRERLALCEAEVVACDGSGLVRADAVAVEALARLQLTARRLGARVVLHGASDDLRDMIELMGLSAPMTPAPLRRLTS